MYIERAAEQPVRRTREKPTPIQETEETFTNLQKDPLRAHSIQKMCKGRMTICNKHLGFIHLKY